MIDGEVVDFVRDLGNGPGGDIGVHAGISVAQSLPAGSVVDQVGLAVAPVVDGTGRRLLDGPRLRLEPVQGVATPSGYPLADYRLTSSEGTG